MSHKTSKAAVIRTLVRTCCLLPSEAQRLVGCTYSELTAALKPAVRDTRASKSECARVMKAAGYPVSAIAEVLRVKYSHAYAA
jgi:hypothetical protein